MNNIKAALTRKIGPLPAWVYAIVFGVAVYWYRNRNAKPQTVLDPATQPGVMDSQVPQDIVPLQPGESAYNPNTGQLVGTAPEQFPPNPAPDRPLPVTLEPGETVYDPATGKLIGGPPAAAPAAAKPKATKPRFSLRPGVTLDKGNKLVKGAHAHYHGRAGTLGPTGGFHPLRAAKKRIARAKPKPKAPKSKAAPKARSAAHLTPSRVAQAPAKPPPRGRTRAPAPGAAHPAPKKTVAHATAKPVTIQHAQPVRAAPSRRPAPKPTRKRR